MFEYKIIPGYTKYAAGSDGNIYSKHSGDWVALKPHHVSGRFAVTLYENSDEKRWYVSRLVLLAFVGPCPNGMEACHNNGNPYDDRPTNLRWDTRQSNVNDQESHGTSKKKLTVEEVRQILTLPMTEIEPANKFSVSQLTIGNIRRRKTWKYVTI